MSKVGDTVKSLHTRANKYGAIFSGELYWIDGVRVTRGLEHIRLDGAGTTFWPAAYFYKVNMGDFDEVIMTEEGFDIINWLEKQK